eukprot:TRINITY_DN11375_c0_g1_i1.p1 TRINITY_DN11375_c0_g1~~TRINITY_DN11375_c0_g1_i1.p1  ORF type:complete len:156 (-),score=36.15 TRINITY_DN11375_c0_g1_i1:47-514(-)
MEIIEDLDDFCIPDMNVEGTALRLRYLSAPIVDISQLITKLRSFNDISFNCTSEAILNQIQLSVEEAEEMLREISRYSPAYGNTKHIDEQSIQSTLKEFQLDEPDVLVWGTLDFDDFERVFEDIIPYARDWAVFGMLTFSQNKKTVCYYTCQDTD